MNKVKIAVLFSCVVLALGGCAGGKKQPQHITTLQQAMEVQKADTNKAIVFATVEDERGEKSALAAFGRQLIGKDSSSAGITFVGNAEDVNSAAFKQLNEKVAELNKHEIVRNRIVFLNEFGFYKKKNWALVQPAKYAVHKMQSTDAYIANMRSWGRQDGKAYMVFDVNPGDVIYLGHIRTNWDNGKNIGVLVEDRFEELRATLPAELQGKVQKRLIKAPSHILAEEMTEVPRLKPKFITVPVYR